MKRFKFGLCELACSKRGMELCKLAKEAGFDGVQLAVRKEDLFHSGLFNKNIVDEYLLGRKQLGIEFTSICLTFLDHISMCKSDQSPEYKTAIKIIFKSIDLAKKMGIPIVMCPSFNDSEINNEQAFNLTVRNFKELCQYASQKGIVMATETNMEANDMIRLINEVGAANLKIYFDSQNHYLKRNTYMPDLYEKLAPYICEIHVKDGRGKELSGALLGAGDTDFYKTAEKILASNFTGNIVTENYYHLPPLSSQGEELELLKKDVKTMVKVFG